MQPSAPIRAKYINQTKYHKMELVDLIRDSVKVVRRGAAVVPFFSSHILILTNGEFYAAKRYIHVVQEGSNKYLFDVPVPSVKHAHQYVSARVSKELVEGENIAKDLPSILSGRRGNLNNDDMN